MATHTKQQRPQEETGGKGQGRGRATAWGQQKKAVNLAVQSPLRLSESVHPGPADRMQGPQDD